MTDKEGIKLIDSHVAALMEHFDAVQIFATKSDGEGTEDWMRGGGNWYARQGLAHEFITRGNVRSKAHEMSCIENENDPD